MNRKRIISILYYSDILGYEEDVELFCSLFSRLNKELGKKYTLHYKFTQDCGDFQSACQYQYILIDYGGLDVGTRLLVDEIDRNLLLAIKENPSTCFIIVSNDPSYFIREAKKEYNFPNVELIKRRKVIDFLRADILASNEVIK